MLLVSILLFIPAINLSQDLGSRENYVGLGVVLLAALLALVVCLALDRNLYRPWIGFATSALDVSLVSGALAIFLLLDEPHTAVNSKVVFEAYFLAIFATSLRYDPRICVLTGLLAVAQYAAIVAWADAGWALNDARYAPFSYGMFSWNAQLGRLVLLVAASVLSAAIVVRSRSLRRLSTSDRLTGLLRRGFFDERLQDEASRARRYDRRLSLAMVDVDHFKLFNDAYGHEAGDVALRAVAATLRESVRQSDIVARYGGEEFVVILPETDAAGAADKMEAIRRAVAALPIQLSGRSETQRETVSVGVASWPEDGAEIEAVLGRADARMFKAKKLGRNCVVGPEAAGLRETGDPRPALAAAGARSPAGGAESAGPAAAQPQGGDR